VCYDYLSLPASLISIENKLYRGGKTDGGRKVPANDEEEWHKESEAFLGTP